MSKRTKIHLTDIELNCYNEDVYKRQDVTLIDVRLGIGIGGKSFAVLTGDVAAVEEAVKCGMAAGTEKGLALSSVVIPSPREEIFAALL